MELESLLAEAYADADDVLRPRIEELEADNTKLTKKLEAGWVRVCQTGLVEAHDRIAELERVTDDLATLVRQLVRALRKAVPQHDLPDKAIDYLKRKGLQGSPLRHNTDLELAQAKIKALNGLCLYHEGLERELQAVNADLVQRLQSLVGSVEVNLDAALPADDE